MSGTGKNTKMEVNELDRVTVTSIEGGLTLVQLGVVLNPRTYKVSVVNVGSNNIYVSSSGAADATNFLLVPYAGITMTLTLLGAQRCRFFIEDGQTSDVNVQQEGDE